MEFEYLTKQEMADDLHMSSFLHSSICVYSKHVSVLKLHCAVYFNRSPSPHKG